MYLTWGQVINFLGSVLPPAMPAGMGCCKDEREDERILRRRTYRGCRAAEEGQ